MPAEEMLCERWIEGFDLHASAGQAAGMSKTQVYRATSVPDETVVINEIADRRPAEEFTASDDVQSGNRRLGVIGYLELYCAEEWRDRGAK